MIIRRDRPMIVCLCGSTRFLEAYREANLRETLRGNIVLTIGCDMRTDADLFDGMTPTEFANVKRDLDILHMNKIELADRILVLNVGGYIGSSTKNEINYALLFHKAVDYWETTL